MTAEPETQHRHDWRPILDFRRRHTGYRMCHCGQTSEQESDTL